MAPHPLEANLWAMHRDFSRFGGTTVHDEEDLLWYSTPSGNSWLNGASRCRLGTEAGEVVARLIGEWRKFGVGVMWHQTPSSQPDNLGTILRENDFQPEPEPGMSLSLDQPLEAPPPELVVSPVRDDAGVLEWVNTFDLAFGGSPRGREHPWRRPFEALYARGVSPGRLFIGRVDGGAVATSLGFVNAGAVGLYGVGTVPEQRGKGYGGAVTLAAARWGRERGAEIAVLAATESGFPVYERLGFRTECETTAWVRDPEPAATLGQPS